jgi:3-hydroxyethyl bacteriochlorophyllide a dehydrogenase
MNHAALDTTAVVLEVPKRLALRSLALTPPEKGDVVVDIVHSGISTGTEKLLWSGRMPQFPGLGYPLVPGYESVGEVVEAGWDSGHRVGDMVFVPGARCYGDVRGLFGGAASRLVAPGGRALAIDAGLSEQGVLLALAATAYHALKLKGAPAPDLIVGNGVLGRLIGRLAALGDGPPPVIWEKNPARRQSVSGCSVVDPAEDGRRDYRAIIDASGDARILDGLIARLAPGGVVTLAGFYEAPLSFAFPPAFMREARILVAAEWREADLVATRRLVGDGLLSLDGLITHRASANDAESAYRTAFEDADCLKMVLDWSDRS